MMLSAPVPAALTVLEMARAGRFAEIRDLFSPQLRSMVPAEALQAAWDAELRQRGQVRSVGTPVAEPAHAGVVVVKVPVTCERGELTLVVSVTETGWLAGLQLASASAAEPVARWEPPAYADPEQFDDQDIEVGSGPLAVPGTLSLPRQPGPHAAIVLLAGSGPQDRDETIGRNKPLKDLAWGLASHGIGVLRFDKVTFAHRTEMREAHGFTLNDEYLPQAIAAINLLRQHPAVDAGRIFLLGHSLGGTVAPRVAAAEPAVAGLIILAGGAQPLHWVIVRQTRYLASLDPETAAASEAAIAALSEQARLVDSPDLSRATAADDLPFGAPASYWLDLRSYNPVEVAAMLHKPILMLQGGRDYQATVDDDLKLWKAGLADHPDVTVHVYPPDNHMFFAGHGPSTPAEYDAAQHVDPTVITDIASWVNDDSRPTPHR